MPRLPHIGALQLLLRQWQLLTLAPISYARGRGARCSRLVTTSAAIKWLILLALSPLLLQQSVSLYEATNVQHSSLFRHIALGTMAGDLGISLALLGAHLWQRQRLAKLINSLVKLQQRVGLGWCATLLLWAKMLLSLYELLCNVPFLQQNAARLPWLQLLAYSVQLYVQHVSSVFGNGIFGALLLLLTHIRQLQHELQVQRCWQREQHLLRIFEQFVSVFQPGMLLLVLGSFINILANMYAYMSYFVAQHGVPLTISNYCLIVAIQLYALILVAYVCQLQHQRLRSRCLELYYVPATMNAQQAALPTKTLSWPLLKPHLKFSILGLFELDNAFWLFLVSYAVNFIVIILQFTLENMKR
ncbi:Gr89a [Drosophila busckii]|uniref:Gustatory receptor n=1 Tax=Drosophila busckii TaxID=30019 RepID=A0A0M3QXL2_DROBS|nr:putative gustatory receptor 89a [Drosophila busckii]ALC46123.1 Gr89a [Drosophila busckii]